MSQANRARFGCHGTGVKLAGSGIAARSGSFGPWPISPVANPANPAPSANTSSRWFAGTSFAFALPYISTNCAKMNSIPILSTSVRTSSTDVGASAIVSPFLSCGSPHPAELDHLRRNREREPVLAIEVDARHTLDPMQSLTKRVGMDEQCARGGDHVAAVVEVSLERVEELCPSLSVVLHQQTQPLLSSVP